MKKTKNKNLRRVIGFLALAALVAGLAAMPLLTKDAAAGEEYPVSILSASAQRQELTRVFSGGGTLHPAPPRSCGGAAASFFRISHLSLLKTKLSLT